MKKKRIFAILGIIFALGMALSGVSLITTPPKEPTDVDPTSTGYVYLGIAALVLIISIIVLIKNKKKKEPRYDYDNNYGNSNNHFSYNENNSYGNNGYIKPNNNRKPFPHKVWAVITLIFVYGSAIGINLLVKEDLFDVIGGIAYKGIIPISVVFLIFGIYSARQLFFYAPADKIITSNYFFAIGTDVTMASTMKYGFKGFFPAIFGSGPLVYTNRENDVARKRVIHYIISMIMKFVFPYISLIGLCGYVLKWANSGGQSVLNFSLDDLYKGLALLLLVLGPSLDVLVYVFMKIIPTHKITTYEVTFYYSNGYTEKGEILRSNIIAVIFMGSLTYLYTCGFFWYFCPRQLGRIKETLKFVNYGDEHYEMVNIYDYYRNH